MHEKNFARVFGLVFLLLSIAGILGVFYEIAQPWWKEISGYFVEVPVSIKVERAGVFLQLLAGLSIIPELLGDEKLRKYESFLDRFSSQIREINPLIPLFDVKGKYISNRLEQRFVLITTVLWMLSITIMWIYPLFSSQPEYANMKKGLYSCFMLMFLATVGATGRLMAEGLVFIVRGITVWSLRMLPIKRLVSFVSFPLFLIGTLLQLAATFLS